MWHCIWFLIFDKRKGATNNCTFFVRIQNFLWLSALKELAPGSVRMWKYSCLTTSFIFWNVDLHRIVWKSTHDMQFHTVLFCFAIPFSIEINIIFWESPATQIIMKMQIRIATWNCIFLSRISCYKDAVWIPDFISVPWYQTAYPSALHDDIQRLCKNLIQWQQTRANFCVVIVAMVNCFWFDG